MASKTHETIEVGLVADKVTKGAVRFVENDGPLSVYLRKEQVEALGLKIEDGQTITITIAATS